MPEIALPDFGRIRYSDTGSGPVVVLIHGLLVDGRLWREVAPRLADRHRVIVPDLPLGAHELPLDEAADRSPAGMARLIADFLEALELEDVTLVGNDTGGALCQVVATRQPERIGRLVLTPCDSYDNFLPPLFRPLQMAARVPLLLTALVQPLRLRMLRRAPFAFGWLTKHGIPRELEDAWVRPFFADARIRRDVLAFLAAIDSTITVQAARDLAGFDCPALVAWAPEDKIFPFQHAERLAATLPQGRLERIEDSRTFVSLDASVRTAELIAAFVASTVPQPAA